MTVNTLAGDCVIAAIMTLNSIDPSAGWTGVTQRNADDLGNADPNEWAGAADTLVVASPSTPLAIAHAITGNRQLAAVVLRRTP